MHDLLTKAVEAGSRAAAARREDFTSSGYLGADMRLWDGDKHVFTGSEAECNAWVECRCAEAALRAALPGILEAVVGVIRKERLADTSAATSEAYNDAIGDAVDAVTALVAQILEGK